MIRVLFVVSVLCCALKALAIEDIDTVIGNLSNVDRKIVIAIKQELASWPKKLLDEVKSYQDMVITLRKQAQQKYNTLSPAAKSALKKEEQLTAKLSPSGLNSLSALTDDSIEKNTDVTQIK